MEPMPSVSEVETNKECVDFQDNTETNIPNFHNYGFQPTKTIEVPPNGIDANLCKSIIFKFGDSYMCPECQKTFMTLSNLKRHVVTKHYPLMSILFPLSKAKVPSSRKRSLKSNENSEQPTDQSNPPSDSTEKISHVCPECPKKNFDKRYNLKRHVRFKHPSLFETLFTSKNSVCDICDKICTSLHALQKHKSNYHNQNVMTQHKCPLCPQMIIKTRFNEHFEKSHNLIMKPFKINFVSYEEFLEWKKAIERVTKTYFVKSASKKVQKNGVTTEGFICHRSGTFKSESVMNRRKLKTQGSRKINAFCPATMKVSIEKEGMCQLIFQNQHIGHDNELHHLNLTVEEKKYVADKLVGNVDLPISDILSIIHNSAAADGIERLCLLNKKDLYNIRANFLKDNQFYLSAPTLNEKLAKDLKDIFNKHTDSEHIHADIAKIDKGWVLTLTDSNEIYLIKEISNSCNCALICIYCRVCINRYSCTCSDSSINGNMCKHIHFFCREKKKMHDDLHEYLDLNSDMAETSSNSGQCSYSEKSNNTPELSEISENNNNVADSFMNSEKSALIQEFSDVVKSLTTVEEYQLSKNSVKDLVLKLKTVHNQTVPIDDAVISVATQPTETMLVTETAQDHLYSSPLVHKISIPRQNSISLNNKVKKIKPKVNLAGPASRTLILEMRNVSQGAKVCYINFAKPDKK